MNSKHTDPVADPIASLSSDPIPRLDAASARLGDVKHLHHPAGGVGVKRRLGARKLHELAERLGERDRTILETVGRFRLIRGDQLQRLYFHELATAQARARVSLRTLQRLIDLGLLTRTARRIGGAGAGSGTHTYLLTPSGRRVVAHLKGAGPVSDRGVHEPGLRFHAHTIAISELYVRTVEADRAGDLELLAFDPEPQSWRAAGRAGSVKPDAYVVVALGPFEHSSFVEIDLATEGRSAIGRKLTSYISYYRSGREQREHDVFPRILWITPHPGRRTVIQTLVDAFPADTRRLFATTLSEDAVVALADEDTETDR
jgi:hypothetical protein